MYPRLRLPIPPIHYIPLEFSWMHEPETTLQIKAITVALEQVRYMESEAIHRLVVQCWLLSGWERLVSLGVPDLSETHDYATDDGVSSCFPRPMLSDA